MRVKKISKTNFDENRYKIILISDGFIHNQEKDFWNACSYFEKKLLDISPFNFFKSNNSFLDIYGCFEKSKSFNPLLNQNGNSISESFLESQLSIDTGIFSINTEKLKNTYSNLLSEIGDNDGNNLLIVLLPKIDNYPTGIEKEIDITESNDIYFVSTTLDGYWENTIINAFARLIGLKEEYYFENENHLQTIESEGNWLSYFYPNLFFYPTESVQPSKKEVKWRNLIPNSITNLKINTFESAIEDNYFYHQDKIELWEGGGGYRKHIFRSAKNCILRYRIGAERSLLKNKRIPFCPACEQYIKSEIFKSEKKIEFPFNQIDFNY